MGARQRERAAERSVEVYASHAAARVAPFERLVVAVARVEVMVPPLRLS